MIEMVRDASHSSSIGQDIERLYFHLNTIAEVIRDRGVSERGLSLLIDTTHDLSSTLALQDLLRTIVSRARSLVGANVAYLTMLDEDHRILRTVTAEGHVNPATSEMKTRVGYGAVSLTINSKTFFDTQDYLHDQRFRHSEALDRAFKAEGIVSLAGFPILSEDKLQGVLFVADRYRRKLSEREISILGSFALHAGVAMRNAHAFTKLSEALAEAERNRNALIDHIHRVDVSAAAHDEMTSLLAKGTEWPLFIQRMADQIDGAIILYDEFSFNQRAVHVDIFWRTVGGPERGQHSNFHAHQRHLPVAPQWTICRHARCRGRALSGHGVAWWRRTRRKPRHLPPRRTGSDRHSQPGTQHGCAFNSEAVEREA